MYYTSELSSVADTFATLATRLMALSMVISDPDAYEAASDDQQLDSDTRSMLHQLCIQPSAHKILGRRDFSTDCLSQHFVKASSPNKRNCWHDPARVGHPRRPFLVYGGSSFSFSPFSPGCHERQGTFELISMLGISTRRLTISSELWLVKVNSEAQDFRAPSTSSHSSCTTRLKPNQQPVGTLEVQVLKTGVSRLVFEQSKPRRPFLSGRYDAGHFTGASLL
jgi:hypothetical protein